MFRGITRSDGILYHVLSPSTFANFIGIHTRANAEGTAFTLAPLYRNVTALMELKVITGPVKYATYSYVFLLSSPWKLHDDQTRGRKVREEARKMDPECSSWDNS